MALASEIDPLSPIIDAGNGLPFYFTRQYDEAIERYRKALQLDPHFAPAHSRLAAAYLQKGMIREATAAYQKAYELSHMPTHLRGVAYAYAVGGNSSEALRVLEQLKQLAEQRYVSPVEFALIYAALGEMDLAFQWCQRAYTEHDGQLVYFKVDPSLDPLRADPRFTDLLVQVGLAP